MINKIYQILEELEVNDKTHIKENFKKINDKYRDKESKDFSLNSIDEALVYSLYRLPATYSVIDEVIKQGIDSGLKKDEIKTVLDIGAGPGSSVLALFNYFYNLEKVTLLEKEKSMINIGEKLINKYISENIIESNKISYEKNDILNSKLEKNYDLVVSSYMLNELNENQIEDFANSINQIDFKYAIFITPGTPEFFKKLITFRDIMIKREKINILAPCTFLGKCNMSEGDWCHFSKRINRSKTIRALKEAEHSYEDEKFSYIVFSKNNNLNKEKDSYRVIRHPLIRKGLIELNLCSKTGLENKIFTKGKDKETYKDVKKLEWGSKYKGPTS